MATLTVTVELDGRQVGEFGIHATTTPDCAKWQHVYDTIGRANVIVRAESKITLLTEGEPTPRTIQFATLRRYLNDCLDEVE